MADPWGIEQLLIFLVPTGFLLLTGGLGSLGRGAITILVPCKTWMSPLEIYNRLVCFPKLSVNPPWFGDHYNC